jgi:hypothetical protein
MGRQARIIAEAQFDRRNSYGAIERLIASLL